MLRRSLGRRPHAALTRPRLRPSSTAIDRREGPCGFSDIRRRGAKVNYFSAGIGRRRGFHRRIRQVAEARNVIGECILLRGTHAAQRAGHLWRRQVLVQKCSSFDLLSVVSVPLDRDAGDAVGGLPQPGGAMTGGADMRVRLLPQSQMLSRALYWMRVRLQAREIAGERDDLLVIPELGMRADDLHRPVDARSRPEQCKLLLQVPILLAREARNGAIWRAPRVRLMATHASTIEAVPLRRRGLRSAGDHKDAQHER